MVFGVLSAILVALALVLVYVLQKRIERERGIFGAAVSIQLHTMSGSPDTESNGHDSDSQTK